MAPPRSQILTVPQWFLLPSGSQIINCIYHFCNNYFFILLPSPTFFFIGTASVLFEAVPMEYSTSVKKAKVIVAKTVIIVIHLATRAKSRLLWNCKIHFAIEQQQKWWRPCSPLPKFSRIYTTYYSCTSRTYTRDYSCTRIFSSVLITSLSFSDNTFIRLCCQALPCTCKPGKSDTFSAEVKTQA